MKRFKSGLWYAVVLGIGAFIGVILVSQNLDRAFNAMIGAVICGFFFGLFLEIPGSKSQPKLENLNSLQKFQAGFNPPPAQPTAF